MVVRGEVWLAHLDELDPTVGSEIQKTRPCVVISPPELHDHLRTVIMRGLSRLCGQAGSARRFTSIRAAIATTA